MALTSSSSTSPAVSGGSSSQFQMNVAPDRTEDGCQQGMRKCLYPDWAAPVGWLGSACMLGAAIYFFATRSYGAGVVFAIGTGASGTVTGRVACLKPDSVTGVTANKLADTVARGDSQIALSARNVAEGKQTEGQFQADLVRAQTNLDQFKTQSAAQMRELNDTIRTLTTALETAKAMEAAANQEKAAIKKEMDAVNARLTSVSTALVPARAEAATSQQQLSIVVDQMSLAVNDSKTVEGLKTENLEMGKQLKALGQKISELEKNKSDLVAEKKALEKLVEQERDTATLSDTRVKAANAQLALIQERMNTLEPVVTAKLAELKSIMSQISAAKGELAAVETQITVARATLAALSPTLAAAPAAPDMAAASPSVASTDPLLSPTNNDK